MKTAISLPDEVFERAKRYAKKLGVSRSELFTRALLQFLERQQAPELRESYDRAFGSDSAEDDDEQLRRLAARKALTEVEW